MRRFAVPGGALAIVKGGRLVAARGYGLADREKGTPVEPTSSFALASLSKSITAAAALKLVEQGRLRLDDPALAILATVKQGPRARVADPQVLGITVRELLNHSSGLPRDPAAIGCSPPAVPPLLAPTIACAMTKPLAFAPGTRAQYSNLGFDVLGEIVRIRSGAPDYGEAVQQLVLSPIGIDGARLEARQPTYLPGQVVGYAAGGGRRLPGGGPPNRSPAGGWVASVVEMARFLAAIDGTHGRPLLSQAMIDEMLARPADALVRRNGTWFGLGWDVVVTGREGVSYSKNGGLAGTSTIMGHRAPDLDWVVFLNTGPGRGLPAGGARAVLGEAMRAQLARTATWPNADYWSRYPPDGNAPMAPQ